VGIGGTTVFPSAKTRVEPVKGSAAFWYTISIQTGDMEIRTLCMHHAPP